MMQEQLGGLECVPDQPDEMMQEKLGGKRKGKELGDEERYGAYFALANMLNTSIRTIERIWNLAQGQIGKGQQVDVSNKRRVMLAVRD
jgi:hypothetical protein